MSELNEAVARLERGYIAGIDDEFRDDVRAVLDALKAKSDAASGGDAPFDLTDPWRGLYRPEHLRANGDGDMYHPDLPSWPDYREEGLDKLVRAQGFDFRVVAGEFSDEAVEDGDELYWQEMRAWNPEAPDGDWRLAWKGDTEDGPYAWFVRPMALRPDPEELAARQPVGVEPVAHRVIYPDGSRPTKWDSGKGHWPKVEGVAGSRFEYAFPPAPAAVPVELEKIGAKLRRMLLLADGLQMQWGNSIPLHNLRGEMHHAIELYNAATDPQPAAAKERGDSDRLNWLESDARHYGDGHNEPREVYVGFSWQQSPEASEWPGLRAAIDSAMDQQAKPEV